ncbi:hypothetical protein K438DRAFT_440375 [Mycena galopus ATCC 62051]|nr:hypothetical protein K438DRAFT_440375 [Mycena galopus ATCC 62051]
MSTQEPTEPEIARSAAPTPKPQHKHSFPPFPAVPTGATIVPFKEFIEHGIRVSFGDEDEVERDGLGIPTIALRVKHDTDISKTNPERGAKKEVRPRGGAFRKEWWEDWAEGEDLRNHGPYDSNVARVDRFHQAASDFQKYRRFPPMSTNVQWLWDQFRIFAGLLGTTPVWQKASEIRPDGENADDADDFDDDEFDNKSKFVNQAQGGERRQRLRPRPPYDLYGKAPVVVEDNDEIQQLLLAARASKEDRVVAFLNDPARGVQVFLSSYMIYQGFVYADKNLISAPHLLCFFTDYLIRNAVFPDKTSARSLARALETIDLAAKQLPLTSTLAKGLPDAFGSACQACWGGRGENSLDPWADSAVDKAFEECLKEENVEVIKAKEIVPPPTSADADADADEAAATAAAAAWDQHGSGAPETEWAAPPSASASLMALLGPTALPLTHAPGVVEWSVRRVQSVVMPSPPPAGAKGPSPSAEPSDEERAEAVERALEACFARVVMAPWVGWDPESPARILRSSVGAVAAAAAAEVSSSPSTSASASTTTSPAAPGPGGLKPHDMHADDITLLLDPALAATLAANVGMGLGGTWVQLARRGDFASAEGGEGGAAAPAPTTGATPDAAVTAEGANARPKKKKTLSKTQKERRGLRYWYLDETMMVVPSYWAV